MQGSRTTAIAMRSPPANPGTRFHGPHMKHMNRSVPLRFVLAIAAVFLAYELSGVAYFLVLSAHYKSYIPAQLEIEESIFAGDRIGGFNEGCGVAVFRLSGSAAENASRAGIDFLSPHPSAESSGTPVKGFKAWKESPFHVDNKEARIFRRLVSEDAGGNTCVDMPPQLRESILSALGRPGSFHSGSGPNAELIVIPALRLAVYSHDR